jgi:hypothetical protein
VSARGSPLGSGLYFIDVLACLLFCLALALVGARFGTEHMTEIELPRRAAPDRPGAELTAWEVSLRELEGEVTLAVDGEPLTLEDFETRLGIAPPPALVIHSGASTLARVIALAHASGVDDIELAYAVREVSQ